jgi:hypothetical protein
LYYKVSNKGIFKKGVLLKNSVAADSATTAGGDMFRILHVLGEETINKIHIR